MDQNKIIIATESTYGAARALSTLLQATSSLPERAGDLRAYGVGRGSARDSPVMRWREVTLDASDVFFPTKTVERHLFFASVAKFNALRLVVGGERSVALDVDGAVPYTPRHVYDLDALGALAALGHGLGVKLYVGAELPARAGGFSTEYTV